MSGYDIVVVGAGAAGLSCAIFGARAGANVLVLEKAAEVGGGLPLSDGHIAAAGARRQKEAGIEDSLEAHLDDIDRISDGTVREDLVRLALEGAPPLIDWLEGEGFAFAPGTPRLVDEHEPYGAPRTFHGVEGGRSVLEVLRGALEAHVASGAVTLLLNARVKALLTDGDRVVGVQYVSDGLVTQTRARRGVVLATGGFAAAPDLFLEVEGQPLHSAAAPTSTGDGLVLAHGLGAHLAGRGAYIPRYGALPDASDPQRVSVSDRPVVIPRLRPPHEIHVDRHGKRFMAEDESSIDRLEHALLRTEGLQFFMILDDPGLEASSGLVQGWTAADVRAKAGRRPGLWSAPSLAELAAHAGIDAAALVETVERYNGFVSGGADPDFGRRYLPAPIEKPPYYAIQNLGASPVSFAGIDVDARLRVRREDGSVIPGLFAAGEILGACATSGSSFCDGMLLGPALVLGRRVGEHLARPVS